MKTRIADSLLLVLGALGVVLHTQVLAQTLTTLHSFTALNRINFDGNETNTDGANPSSGLLLSGRTLYGTTPNGGNTGNGTVFKINTDGTAFVVLHSFTAIDSFWGPTNSDGARPFATLVLADDTLYGTTASGGLSGNGTIFALNINGTSFTNLHNFSRVTPYSNTEGSFPQGQLVLSRNTLYGTARAGGVSGNGTVFKVNINGSDFTTLHSFPPEHSGFVVEDGAAPYAGLALAEDTLYGTTAAGGNYGNGTLFSLKTDGTAFTNLHSFAASYCDRERCWNSDGVVPQALLTVSGGKVYGTASLGGPSGNGTMFAMNTDGTEFTMIHQFTELIRNGWYGPFFNSDGTYPVGGLVLSGKILYGTATFGGTSDQGTVFAIGIDGTGFTALHSFSESVINTTINSDGAAPFASLILSGNVLYGTTFSGGEWGKGTLFSLSLPPPISISCPAPLILECTSGRARGTIEINVQSSRASSLAIVWTIDSVPYQTNDLPSGSIPFSTNVTLSADFALGDHLVTVSAASGETESVTCSTTVQVRDTIPPVVLGISATPNLLWPPNHKMVPVAIEVQAIDNCGEPTSKIVAVASNEPLGSHNDKDGRDWVITGDLTAGLRAERLGSGQGRTYTIFVECRDAARNSSLSSVIIIVPAHN